MSFADGTAGTPYVGDAYGSRSHVNVHARQQSHSEIKWTLANVTLLLQRHNCWARQWMVVAVFWWLDLDDRYPWSVTLDA